MILIIFFLALLFSAFLICKAKKIRNFPPLETIQLEDLYKECETGDLLLVQNDEKQLYNIKYGFFTHCPWIHISMIFKDDEKNVFVMELYSGKDMNIESRSSIMTIKKWTEQFILVDSRIGWLKWKGEKIDNKKVLSSFHNRKNNTKMVFEKNYLKTICILILKFLKPKLDLNNLFCGEYVCEILKDADVALKGDCIKYLPKYILDTEQWESPKELIFK